MFKRLILIASTALMLAGCNTTIDPNVLAAIQAITVAECGFLPTQVQIAQLFPNAADIAGQVGVIGGIICKAVVTQTPPASRRLAARLGAVTSVNVTLPNGTQATVTGTFVRR